VDKIYALQKAAQQELMQDMANQNLTPDQRRQFTKQYSDKMARSLQQILGEENYKKFQEARRPVPIVQPRP
jgi:hypothetical protein